MKQPRLDALTSCRFFAAALIVLHHAGPYFGYAGPDRVFDLAQGVSFFFVLSGFILAYNYVQPNRAIDRASFYLHRFARIWPAHVAAAALFVYVNRVSSGSIVSGRNQIIANLTLLHAWVPVQSYFFSLNPVSWSISSEFFFYLLFPFMFDRSGKPWRGVVLALGLLAVVLIVGRIMMPPMASNDELSIMGLVYISPLSRLIEFSIGCVACYAFQNWEDLPRGTACEIVAVSLAIISLWIPPHSWSWVYTVPGGYVWHGGGWMAFALLIIVLAKQVGLLSHALSAKPLVFLGEVSFCLYLTHYIVFTWFVWHQNYLPKGAFSFAAYLAAIVPIAATLHFLVEKPCRVLIIRCFERKPRLVFSESAGVAGHQE